MQCNTASCSRWHAVERDEITRRANIAAKALHRASLFFLGSAAGSAAGSRSWLRGRHQHSLHVHSVPDSSAVATLHPGDPGYEYAFSGLPLSSLSHLCNTPRIVQSNQGTPGKGSCINTTCSHTFVHYCILFVLATRFFLPLPSFTVPSSLPVPLSLSISSTEARHSVRNGCHLSTGAAYTSACLFFLSCRAFLGPRKLRFLSLHRLLF